MHSQSAGFAGTQNIGRDETRVSQVCTRAHNHVHTRKPDIPGRALCTELWTQQLTLALTPHMVHKHYFASDTT